LRVARDEAQLRDRASDVLSGVSTMASRTSGKRQGVSVGGKRVTVTAADPSGAMVCGGGPAVWLFSTGYGLANGLVRDSMFPGAFPVIAENVAARGHQDCGRRINQLPDPLLPRGRRNGRVRCFRVVANLSAGLMIYLRLVHLGDPDENPDGQLILIPVWGLNGFSEHRQHRHKWKEPLLQAARTEWIGWVPLFSFVWKSIQNPLQQIGCDVVDRSDSYHGAGVGVTAGQSEVDCPIEKFRRKFDLLQRPLGEAMANDRAES
jgi:hypothetical protein